MRTPSLAAPSGPDRRTDRPTGARCPRGPCCPRCPRGGGGKVIGWGRYRDGRRYRCLGCRRTFTRTTGTPVAYLKKAHLWNLFCDFMRMSLPLRDTADVLGIDKDTAFRWRHRFLDAVRAGACGLPGASPMAAAPLEGRIFVAEAWFMFSEKGKRPLDRPARRHAWVTDWLFAPRAWVVLMGDESGRSFGQMTGLRRPTADDLEPVLSSAIGHRDPVLMSRDGPYAQLPLAARRLGIPHQRCFGLQPGPHVEAYRRRLRRWLRPFCGVATRYLPNYLAWHRLVDRGDPTRTGRGLVASPLG